TNQQVSDFHTTEGSVNGSLTDRHYADGGFFISRLAIACHTSSRTRLYLKFPSLPACNNLLHLVRPELPYTLG
ncbi:hypothetical protein ACET98_14455, partial [Aeromonas veronii]